ncbi:hypothetical protein CDEST_15106 [Colletotrichum destructivum]|uniref:Uncharacterized protein n=1 Tax=Colletotrichum destructivum TaxID=34406 RepID=A0AAX4J418_9PEZI|nr:hypothetical protein CDEST_15106 [Colletotrichum destructivum]
MVVTAEMVSKKRRACFAHRCARRDQVLGRPLHPPLYNVRFWRIKSFGVILGDYSDRDRDWESTYNSRQNLLGSSPGACVCKPVEAEVSKRRAVDFSTQQGQKRMEVVDYDTQKQTCDERVPGEDDPGTNALCIMYCLAVQGTRSPASDLPQTIWASGCGTRRVSSCFPPSRICPSPFSQEK